MKRFSQRIARILILIVMVVVTAGCGSQQAAPAVGKGTGSDKPIKVGVTAGPHAEIMEVVKESR